MNLVPYEEKGVIEGRVGALPLSFTPGEPKNVKALDALTPEIEKRYLEIEKGKPIPFIRINYAYRKAIEAFGREWALYPVRITAMDPDDEGKVEIIYEGVFKAPGLPIEGIYCVGGDKYQPKNKMASYANTIKSARADALKDAMRFLGLALDVRDDPKDGAQLEKLQITLNVLVRALGEAGKGDQVKAAIVEHAPQALDGETFLYFHVTDGQLDPLKRALLNLSKEPVKV